MREEGTETKARIPRRLTFKSSERHRGTRAQAHISARRREAMARSLRDMDPCHVC